MVYLPSDPSVPVEYRGIGTDGMCVCFCKGHIMHLSPDTVVSFEGTQSHSLVVGA